MLFIIFAIIGAAAIVGGALIPPSKPPAPGTPTPTPTIGITKGDKGLQIAVLTITFPPTFTPTPGSGGTTPTPPTSGGGGPLICGVNLGLFNNSDTFFTTKVQNFVKQLHVGTIRMPIRNFTPNAIELQAAQIIKSLGLTPLVTLSYSAPDPVAAGKTTIQAMNGIFGNSLVYYEFGNEQFGSGYTAKWNQVIPQLKSLANNAWFCGPVALENFGSTETSNMANFYVSANPRPDCLDWHEYTCDLSHTAQYCYDHIDTAPGHNWHQHILDTQTALQARGITKMPPIFITEWNHISSGPGSGTEPLVTQLANMHFVQQGLQSLKKDGVYAAYYYVLNTNADYNLVDNSGNSLTQVGQDFQATCATF